MKRTKSVFGISCLTLVVGLFFISVFFAEEAAAQAKTLKIGLITSVTGPMAPAFKSLVEGAKPTADIINQRGGITVGGEKYLIQIVTEDDQSSPPGAIAAANKLMQEGVKFMVPPLFMPSNLAIASVTEEAKILRMKAYGLGRDEVGPKLRYSFFASTTAYNIPVFYDYLKKNYSKVKRIAMITPDDPGAVPFQEHTEQEIRKHGMDLVYKEAFKPGSEDFYPILTKALEKKPDAIDVIVSIIPWSAGIINQSRELGFTGPIFAPCIFGDINILRSVLTPKYANDIFQGGPDVLSPKMPSIVKDYRALVEKETKSPFEMGHTIILEAAYVLLRAIEKAQSFDTDKVVATLEGMKSIDTLYGPGRMGGQDIYGINHVIRRPIPITRIMNNKVEFEFSGKD